eukprot:TRINITY_DN3778_c0_g4_i2.p1 TRINITY_DN3778_c0_g4~~TRINITY_DN3778_c0_g4_i2.p1  ORF type:complete len:593 (+),score=129.08 TRINITY_DN3778_c0_g4_i2:88-1866(+)
MGLLRLLLRHAVRDGDSAVAVEMKRFVLAVYPVLSVLLLGFGMATSAQVSNMSHFGFTYGGAVIGAVVAVYVLLARSLPLWVLEMSDVAYTAVIIVGDWGNAATVRAARVWPCVVLAMDMLLTFGGRRLIQGICLHGTAVWLVVSAAEDAFRLGLYDIEGWSEQPAKSTVGRCDCSNPPCAVGAVSGFGGATVAFVCLYVDFFATRGFAEGQHAEQERLRITMQVTEQVASHLVRFDLDSAQFALDMAPDGMPAALHDSCRSLLANLAGYRPYLPQSCFEHQSTTIDPEKIINDVASIDIAGTFLTAPNGTFLIAPHGTFHTAPSTEDHGSAGDPVNNTFGSALSGPKPRASDSSAASPSPDAGEQLRPAPRAAHAAIVKRVSLLGCNRSGFLAAAAQGDIEYGAWLADAVAHFCTKVFWLKGVTDVLCADHLSASFGALKNLGAHRIAAVRCAVEVAQDPPQEGSEHSSAAARLPFTSAVCSGMATCGDFGSASTQRYMVIGGVSALLPVMERAAAGLHAGALVDTMVHHDAQMHWDFRLRQMLVFAKMGRTPIGLWELVAAKDARKGSQAEWMYEMSRATANPGASTTAP